MHARILNWLKPVLSLHGDSGPRDRLVLGAWEVYARLRGAVQSNRRTPACALYLNFGSPATAFCLDADFYRAHILDHLLPFWAQYAVDSQGGGFFTHLDRQGQVYDPTLKTAAMQARILFAFAIGYELSADPAHLRLAQHGAQFLIERMWDTDNGGWYDVVGREGQVKTPDKGLFTQAYVLIGLAEYSRVTGDSLVLSYARQIDDLLERHAWDEVYGGYVEACSADWQVASDAKTICIQLDMWMALSCLYAIVPEERYMRRIRQLADLIMTRMRDGHYGCVLERFTRNWIYDPLGTRDRIQIGHNLKTVWLLLRLFQQTRNENDLAAARRLLEYCLSHGWDEKHGGFYQHVYRNGILASAVKEWWPECEGMQALSLLYRLSGEARCQEYLERLAAFTFHSFWDRECGEWVRACYADGAVFDARKGYSWKAAYHTVQACYEMRNNLLNHKERQECEK